MEAVQGCASKLNTALRRTYGTGERRGDISASTGVAVLTEETGFDELYHLADVALYPGEELWKRRILCYFQRYGKRNGRRS